MLLYNSITSIEKAEKVVKEPKTPIIKKYFIKYSEEILLCKLLANIPMIKEPNILTKKVPKGKLEKYNLKKIEKKYLKDDPIAPPIAT